MDQEPTTEAQSTCRASIREPRTQGRRDPVHECAPTTVHTARLVAAHSQQAPPLHSHVLGTFAETTSPEHQLHWIFENCKVVRDANGLSNIVEAMKIASSKHDFLWYSPSFEKTVRFDFALP